jgi:hypothetical protein
MISRLAVFTLVASVGLIACGGDEETGGKKAPREACESDADCANDSCVVDGTGKKTCADPNAPPGGW